MSVSAHLTGDTLRNIRERAHLMQSEASARLGVSLRTYQTWESKNPPIPRATHRKALERFVAELTAPKQQAAA